MIAHKQPTRKKKKSIKSTRKTRSAAARYPLSNAQLAAIGATHKPPQSWYEAEEKVG
jgi:hypothetical protein